MLIPGLVTDTFRPFSREEVAETAAKAGLRRLEWGGDIHVPPGDDGAAEDAVRLTALHGLEVDTYGSYFRCLPGEDAGAVVGTAEKLGARNLRVWAGQKGSAEISEEERGAVVSGIRAVCRMVPRGMTVSTEFHQNTLTDRYESAVRMAEEVGEENFRLYWQPNQFMDDAYNLAAVKACLPYLSNVHVFTWSGHDRFPLADGERMWRQYIEIVASDGSDHGLFLEFTCDGSVEQLYRDAETLARWLD